VASITKSPVLLVLDASKTARSIAAIALGFQQFHRNSRISGIILNKIGSKKHEMLCRRALEKTKIPIVGVILKNPLLNIKSRHLGLISTLDKKTLNNQIQKTSKIISEFLDIQQIIKILNNPIDLPKKSKPAHKKIKTTIAVALDTSFNFYYSDNLEALRREGANLKFFSPVKDKTIPKCDGLYIGGGFPEVLGNSLEKNQTMKKIIKKLAEDNLPIYAECGGLMYLTKSIIYENKKYKMIGLFDAETNMTQKMKLNYTKGQIIAKTLISDKPHSLRGHEFHYSQLDLVSSDSKFAYDLEIGEGIKKHQDGMMQYNTLASYFILISQTMLKFLLKIAINIQEVDSALINLKIALIMAEADELPPFLPIFVINGTSSNFANSSFDSTAQINPTGIPIIRAGFTIPSFTI